MCILDKPQVDMCTAVTLLQGRPTLHIRTLSQVILITCLCSPEPSFASVMYILLLQIIYYIRGTFDGDFNLAVWRFLLHWQI